MSRQSLIVILGPTATGKSDVAARLARRLGGRVIGADSIQVYRGLDAGSCKPPAEARRAVPHELIDVADPGEPFSAGRFAVMAAGAIEQARAAGQVPIVAGGTGLYLRALLRGIAPIPPRDDEVRSALYERAKRQTVEGLHDELETLDPESAARIGRRDLQRTVRALEVIRLTGVPLSSHLKAHAAAPAGMEAMKIGLTMDRALLYQRIEARVEGIFAAGIVEEVRGLLAAGVPPDCNALKALGYREVMSHLDGALDLSAAVGLVKRNTRRYARRQIMWFRRETGVTWFDAGRETAETIVDAVAAMHAAGGD